MRFWCSGLLLLTAFPLWADAPRMRDLPTVERDVVDQAVLRGVDFLLTRQNRDGSWGSPTRTKHLNIYAPGDAHAAYKAGTTALCLESLLRMEKGLSTFPENAGAERREKLSEAIDRAEGWLLENLPKLRRSSPDVLYNVWGHAYGLTTLRWMYTRNVPVAKRSERLEKIRKAAQKQIEMLDKCEYLSGGWGYYNFNMAARKSPDVSNSFVTATVLVGLADAKAMGVEVPERLVKNGLTSLLRQRRPDGTYLYSENFLTHASLISNSPGSLGRSQAGSLALLCWERGDVATQAVVREWLKRLVVQNGWLDVGRKRPKPHESYFLVAGYFYYYAHYYAAQLLERVDDPSLRADLANHLVSLNLPLQEKNGSWWDYPLYDYHPFYGTAMAVVSLLECRRAMFGF
ncbi:MAG: hypothetical protein Q4D98_04355 [Planctomycetia bacterium]|nr:hypothetical protein [Planctomycetia bacterium]